MISWTSFEFNTIIKIRIENENFAGDAFMRHPIFILNTYIFSKLKLYTQHY